MAVSRLQSSMEFGICRNHVYNERLQKAKRSVEFLSLFGYLSSASLQRHTAINLSKRLRRRVCTIPLRAQRFRCHCFLFPDPSFSVNSVKNATLALARSIKHSQGTPVVIKLASAVGIVIFAIWGLRPLARKIRNSFLNKSDKHWTKSSVYHAMISYIQPLLLWAGAVFICRSLDPIILPSEASQIVKQRLLSFVRSLSTVLSLAYCLSSAIQQAQNYFMPTNDPSDARTMGFQFAGRAVYTAVWVAALSLFMELLGFSTQKWITAGGFGTVLLTLAGREILTNFLSSVMIHATRPFVLNEWIQTKIEGYEVSGTVEHVGWWSATVIRGDDREAIYIPNHKFTVNVVRNLTQKTHWRVKTHLAISHLDVGKINSIVADMRKVLAKNPHVEQQKLHRRVFLDNVDTENQALLIMISCFVKTPRFEEYLCVKEGILLDLLRVIRHHRARLATPIRTFNKMATDNGMTTSDTIYNGVPLDQSLIVIEPSYKVNGDDRAKTPVRSETTSRSGEADSKPKEPLKSDAKLETESAREDHKPDSENANKTKTDDKFVESTDEHVVEETGDKRHDTVSSSSSSTMQQKQEDSRQSQSQSQTPPISLEENIVLGVALEGSKRTLPIEEDIAGTSTTNSEDPKDFAAVLSNNGPASTTDNEKSDAKRPPEVSGDSVVDQTDQKDK